MKRQKHPLIAGTLILTATGVVTRFIGFFYKIFLSRAIGAEGLGIYQMIFPVYGVCYALTGYAGLYSHQTFLTAKLHPEYHAEIHPHHKPAPPEN